MTKEDYARAARYWDEKDALSAKMPRPELEARIDAALDAHNTCALATASADFVRCTPLEYSYHDGCLWIFSEGGKKFVGLAENSQVALAIFDNYAPKAGLFGLQIQGRAEMVEPFSERYRDHAAKKGIPIEALEKLPEPMHLICIHPERFDLLDSSLKAQGYGSRQTLTLD